MLDSWLEWGCIGGTGVSGRVDLVAAMAVRYWWLGTELGREWCW